MKKSENRKAAEIIINKCIELYLLETDEKRCKDATDKAMDDLEKQLDKKLPVSVVYVCPDDNNLIIENEDEIKNYLADTDLDPDYEVQVNKGTIVKIYKD